jgi:hypothetical protein
VDSGFAFVNPGPGDDYRPQMGAIRLMVVTGSEEHKHLVAAPGDIKCAFFGWLKSEWKFLAIPGDRE